MSGSMLANALLTGGGQQPGVGGAIPLASIMGALSPNGAQLQQQNPRLPWYAIPGMFQPPPAVQSPQAALAPPPAPPPPLDAAAQRAANIANGTLMPQEGTG